MSRSPAGSLVVLVLGVGQVEALDGRAGDRPVVRGGDVGEQQPACGAGHPHEQEEVLVDRDQPERAAVAGEAAQRGGERVEVGEQRVGELLDLPDALLAVGDQGEVDALEGLGGPRHDSLLVRS